MRIIFMGTPAFSVPTLNALLKAGHEIVACYSQPPRPAGRRGLELKKSPVHEAAEQHGIVVRTPKSLKIEQEQSEFAALKADVAVVVAYGLLLPRAILEGTKFGCYNGHASLLPRWRGAAPIQRAIMAGDQQTGMMIMKMDEGLDTGDIALSKQIVIEPNITSGELHDALSNLGADLMVRAMAALENGTLTHSPQPEQGVTYASKIDKSEARIDFLKSANETHNIIRGLAPFPGAWCEMQIGDNWERIKLLGSICNRASAMAPQSVRVLDGELEIGCATGSVKLTKVQKAGSKAMSAQDFARGAPIKSVR